MNHFAEDGRSAVEAQAEAQRIAFAPVVFQACRLLRKYGLLDRVYRSRGAGLTLSEIAENAPLPRYGVKVLMESGLGIGLFTLKDGRFTLTKLGYFVLRDPMTHVNMDVVHDVCYRGLFHLDEALEQGQPAGLRTLGDWNTLYEGLASLPSQARQSWLTWNHFYSDLAFPAALPLVFADRPRRILDVGGNTGKFAAQCTAYDAEVHITIADLPQQLDMARAMIREHGLAQRIEFSAVDLLDDAQPLPAGHDVVWMSQLLDCFAEPQIVSILRRCAGALGESGSVQILELLWDRQPNPTAAFCLQQTSLYFACIANGNSQMYHSADLLRCLSESGLTVVEQHDQVGQFHTWIKCRRA